MALTKETKKTIDIVAPTVAAGATAYLVFQKSKDWRILLGAIILAWLLFYVITSQITKAVKLAGDKPEKVNKPGDSGGKPFDPVPYVEQLHKDLYSTPITGHNDGLWSGLAALSTDNLIDIYNTWNDRYFSEYSESLVAAIADDHFSWLTWDNANNVMQRLQANGAH